MSTALKDRFFSREFFEDTAARLKALYPAFDTAAFFDFIYDDAWDGRALKERMRHGTLALGRVLPDDYRAALDLLRQVAPSQTAYGFDKMIFPDFVEVYGLDDWEASLPALEEFTRLASAEFAVRPFIVQDQDRMMAQMLAWAGHEHPGVRRLASEGSRPRLPWAIALPALKADPAPILPILDRLKLDPEEAVRRSVANNLNDISRDNPQVTLDVLRGWQDHDRAEIQWITGHALRTLVKKGNSQALALLGYGDASAVTVSDLTIEPASVPMGEALTFSFTVESSAQAPASLMIDYIMYFMRANGQQTAKVFKLSKPTLAPGESLRLSRSFSFKPISTRKYYPGAHAIAIQVNGTVLARQDFEVV